MSTIARTPIPSRYIEIGRAAQRLGVHRQTVLAMLNRGQLTEWKLPGLKRRFVSEKSLKKAINRQSESTIQ